MFRYQRWVDVLEWFAEQADLSLVMDAPPPGTFNYTDTREYSPEEAIDLLNSVLLTKGYTLIRRGRMLMLLDLSQAIPDGLIPQVDLENLDQHGKFELVTVQFDLGRRTPETAEMAIKPLLGPHHKLTPVATTRQLFVTDRAGVMQSISRVIQSIPEPKDAVPAPPPAKQEPKILQVYTIEKADPQAVVEVLDKLLTGDEVVYDARLNQLHILAPASHQETAKAVLAQIESPTYTESGRRLEVYPLDLLLPEGLSGRTEDPSSPTTRRQRDERETQPASAADRLLESLKAIIPGASLSIDENSRSLLAWAIPSEHEILKQALEKMGQSPAGAAGSSPQLEVYRVTRSDPDSFLPMLEKLAPRANLTFDAKSQNLIALATPADQQVIRSALEQLGSGGLAAGDDEFRFQAYPLPEDRGGTAAAAIQAQLETLVPGARMTLEARSNRLIIYGTAQEHELVARALEKLTEGDGTAGDPTIEVYPIQGAQPAELMALLERVAPEAELQQDTAGTRLIAIATPRDHQAIKQALDKLGQAGGLQNAPQLEVHRLGEADPDTITALLAQLVPHARVTLDRSTSSLIVLAIPADQQTVRATLEQLHADAGGPDTPVLQFLSLVDKPAENLLRILQDLVPKAKITADDEGRRLTVLATERDQELVKQVVEQYEASAPLREPAKLVVYPVTQAQRGRFESLLPSLAEQMPELKLVGVSQPGELAVWARPTDHVKIAELLKRLDVQVPRDEQFELQVYPFAGDPAAVTPLLQKLFPEAQCVVDAKTRRILVWARTEEHARLGPALQQLGAPPSADLQEQFKAYSVPEVSPTILLPMLQQLVPDARVSSDPTSGRILAWATIADQATIARTLEELSQVQAIAGRPAPKAYLLQSLKVEDAIRVLTAAVPKAQFTQGGSRRQLLAVASPDDQEMIAAVLADIDSDEAAAGDATAVVYPLEGMTERNSFYVMRWLATAVPEANFTLGVQPNQVVAWASPDDHRQIQTLVDQLARDPAPDRTPTVAVYTLQHIPASEADRVLEQGVPEADVTVSAEDPQRMTVWARPAEHEAIQSILQAIDLAGDPQQGSSVEIYSVPAYSTSAAIYQIRTLMSAFPRANFSMGVEPGQIIAWATAKDHAQIQALVERMKTTPPEETLQLAVYELQFIEAERAIELIKPAVPTADLKSDPGDAQRLTAWALPRDQEKIERIVEQIDVEGAAGGETTAVVYTLTEMDATSQAYALQFLVSAVPTARITRGAKPDQLVAWATPRIHEQLAALVAELNKQPPPESAPKAAVYTTDTISAASAAQVLTSAVPRATITVDKDHPQRMTVWARPQEHQTIAAILQEIDVAGDPQQQSSVEIYSAPAASLTVAYYQIQTLVAAFPAAKFSVGSQPGQIVAWASAKDHAQIKSLVERMKTPPADETLQLAVYTLQFIAAERAIELIQPAVPTAELKSDPGDAQRLTAWALPRDQETIKRVVEQIDVEAAAGGETVAVLYSIEDLDERSGYYAMRFLREAVPTASITTTADEKQLIVWATPRDQERIRMLVEQLTKGPPLEEAPTAAVYSLQFITATAAAELLGKAVPRAEFTLDPAEKSRLTAWASPADQSTIQAILQQIDVESEAGASAAEVYRLDGATAASATAAITLLTTAFPTAKFSLGTSPQEIVAWGSPKDHAEIKRLIERVNAGPPPDQAPKATVYTTKFITAAAVAEVLAKAAPDAAVTMDPDDAQRLTVWATPTDHRAIEQILAEVDVEIAATSGMSAVIYSLEELDRLAAIYAFRFLTTAVPNARFSPGAQEGQVLAWAGAKDHQRIKMLVDELTKAPPQEQAPAAAVYSLKFITSATAAELLGKAVPRAEFTLDPADTGRLTAWAGPEDQQTIQAILQQIDIEGEAGGATVEIYLLEGELAATSLPYALRLLATAYPNARVSAGAEPGQLVVWASAKDHAEIGELIDRLNAGPPPDKAERVTVYTLQFIEAAQAQAVLQQAVPEARLTLDPGAPQRLTAWARPTDQATIASILEQIDAEDAAENGFVAVFYSLEDLDERSSYYALRFLREAVPGASITTAAEEGQLIIWASPRDHQRIKMLVDQLTKVAPEDRPQLEVYHLKVVSGETASRILRDAVPRAEATVDADNAQRLTVWARTRDHESVLAVLEKIDVEEDPANQPTPVVYTLEEMDSRSSFYAIRYLAEAFPRAVFSPGAAEGQLVVLATARDHEPIKALVDQMNQGPPPELAPTAKVYPLTVVDASAAIQTLSRAVPDATLSASADDAQVVAWARPADHQKIEEILGQLDQAAPAGLEPQAIVYSVESAEMSEVMRLLRYAVPQARVTLGTEPHQLIAWARAADHQLIQELLDKLAERGPAELSSKVVVYTIPSGDAANALDSLEAAVPAARFSLSSDPRRLIAWARPADHERIQRAVDEITTGTGELTTRVYRFRYADPDTARDVLEALAPAATMAVDENEQSLVVTAVAEDHARILATVEAMDSEDTGGQRPALQAHKVEVGDVVDVYRSLSLLFRNDRTVQLSLDDRNDTIIAVAPAAKHERIDEMIQAVAEATRADADILMQLYPMRNIDSTSALDILDQVLERRGGKAELSYDYGTNQLIAIARPEYQKLIADTLDQLRGDEPVLEIYELQFVDPQSAELAIGRQFYDAGFNAPAVDTDPVTQQLFVRASEAQHEQVRDLLVKMGETKLQLLQGRSSRAMRTIPVQGDANAVLEEIQRVWSKLRPNEIRIMAPDQPLPPPAGSGLAPPAAQPPATVPATSESAPQEAPAASPGPSAPGTGSRESGRAPHSREMWFVAAQASHGAGQTDEIPTGPQRPAPLPSAPETAATAVAAETPVADAPAVLPAPLETLPSPPVNAYQLGAAENAPTASADSQPPSSAPPIYVVPGEGTLTVVSDDPEALEQFDRLLRTLFGAGGDVGRNISIFAVKNSDAAEIAEKLRALFPTSSRSASTWRRGTTPVMIVPDEQRNTILVQGSRIDRETIEGLIRALDTDRGQSDKPQLIPIRYADAEEVASVVRDVFRSQLGGYRGTTTESSPMMRSSRRLPSVAVDETTNALILSAPSPLADEILELVAKLDQSAEESPARRLKIVPLNKASSARVEDALQRILQSGTSRRTGSR